jgi:hypothetical protein
MGCFFRIERIEFFDTNPEPEFGIKEVKTQVPNPG